jgi:hypothetical protein
MIGIEWDQPASLTTNAGTLNFNAFPGLILDPHQCSATKTLRAPVDPIPQGDGDIIHRRFQTGYIYKLVCQAYETANEIACLDSARLMFEALGKHLFSMLRDTGRYCWTPSNYGDNRALDQAQWFEGVTQTLGDGGVWQAEFSIDSPFPYVIDLTQTSPVANPGVTITNAGNADFFPVIQIQGPLLAGASCTITNGSQVIVYDTSLPGAVTLGGADYAELDTFKGTIFKNGSDADCSASINPETSDFDLGFVIHPGANSITSVGANSLFLMNNAWG